MKSVLGNRVVKGAPVNGLGTWPLPFSKRLRVVPSGAKPVSEPRHVAETEVKRFTGATKEASFEGSPVESVRIYFNGLRKISLLTASEEKALARKTAKGDQEARRRMIEANLRLVVNVAKRYLNRGLPLSDLIEEGNIGLIRAVERFKASKGCRFSTYATYWIRQSVERAITNQAGVIRLPIHVSADMTRLNKATRDLERSLKREPSVTELSEKTGMSGRYVKRLTTVGAKTYSLDASLPDDSDESLLDRLADNASETPMEMIDGGRRAERVDELLGELDDCERNIIRMRFGFGEGSPMTLDMIGKSFGVTRERVRQIEVRALSKLKKIMLSLDIASLDAV